MLLDEAAGINDGVACEPWPELPIALTPPPPFRTTTQREAILEWGEALAAEPDRRDATLDLLRREPPHLRDGDPLTPVEGETSSRSSPPCCGSTARTSRCRDLPDPARRTSART